MTVIEARRIRPSHVTKAPTDPHDTAPRPTPVATVPTVEIAGEALAAVPAPASARCPSCELHAYLAS